MAPVSIVVVIGDNLLCGWGKFTVSTPLKLGEGGGVGKIKILGG